jgi:hypothetical protein
LGILQTPERMELMILRVFAGPGTKQNDIEPEAPDNATDNLRPIHDRSNE